VAKDLLTPATVHVHVLVEVSAGPTTPNVATDLFVFATAAVDRLLHVLQELVDFVPALGTDTLEELPQARGVSPLGQTTLGVGRRAEVLGELTLTLALGHVEVTLLPDAADFFGEVLQVVIERGAHALLALLTTTDLVLETLLKKVEGLLLLRQRAALALGPTGEVLLLLLEGLLLTSQGTATLLDRLDDGLRLLGEFLPHVPLGLLKGRRLRLSFFQLGLKTLGDLVDCFVEFVQRLVFRRVTDGFPDALSDLRLDTDQPLLETELVAEVLGQGLDPLDLLLVCLVLGLEGLVGLRDRQVARVNVLTACVTAG